MRGKFSLTTLFKENFIIHLQLEPYGKNNFLNYDQLSIYKYKYIFYYYPELQQNI